MDKECFAAPKSIKDRLYYRKRFFKVKTKPCGQNKSLGRGSTVCSTVIILRLGSQTIASRATRYAFFWHGLPPLFWTLRQRWLKHGPILTSYRRRSVVEQCVGWLKECRRIATRFEKLALSFLAMFKLAMIQRYLRITFSGRA